MSLISQLFTIKRLYLNNELLIDYQKINRPSLPISGFDDDNTVSSRYRATSKRLTLSRLVLSNPVIDLINFLNSNKSSLTVKRTGSILDVGCGSGGYSLLFKSDKLPFKDYQYSGCEVNGNLVKICKENYPTCNFFQAVAQSIPAKDREYSLVICSSTLHYIIQDWKKALREMARVAKDHLLITRLPITKHHRSFFVKQIVKSKSGQEVHYFRVFSRHEIEQEIQKLGLTIIARDYTQEEYPITGMPERIMLNNYLLSKIPAHSEP